LFQHQFDGIKAAAVSFIKLKNNGDIEFHAKGSVAFS
jgi:hypothetical protein